jgi:hypothetical protein
VVFFDSPMLLEVPLEPAAASAAASPVWVAVDFDRACRVRRRGVRWRSRTGWFASPISDFSALFAYLRGCLLAIAFILWIRIALGDACTTTSPALGARRAATQEGPSTWTAMLPVPGKVERKVWRDNDFRAFGLMFRRRSGISEQHPRHRAALDGVSVRRRFTASSFPLWGSATSRRLGRITVLPQLKVDRLCSIVDGTADFDPKRSCKPAKNEFRC